MSNFDAFKKINCRKLLVSNVKADFPRLISEKEALRLAKRNNMNLFEINATNLYEAEEVFTNIGSQMYYRNNDFSFDVTNRSFSNITFTAKKKRTLSL